VRPHARRTLHARLDHQGGDLLAVIGEHLAQLLEREQLRPLGVQAAAFEDVRRRGAQHLEEQRVEAAVEGLGATHADRGRGVAVVGLDQRDEAGAARVAAISLRQQGDAQSHLHRGGAGLGVEDARQSRRRDGAQLGGESRAGLVGEAEEGAVGDPSGLLAQRGVEARVGVAVHVGPEAGHAVDVAASLRVDESAALATSNHQRFLAAPFAGLGEGMPGVGAVQADHLVDVDARCLQRGFEDVEVQRGFAGLLQRLHVGEVGDVGQDAQPGDAALRGHLGEVLRGELRVGAAVDVGEHHAEHRESGVATRLHGERTVPDGAQPGATHHQHRGVEAAHQVAHRGGGGQRHQQAADAFDHQQVQSRFGGAGADLAQQCVDVERALLRARGGQR
jgi:hypothetical protein